MEYTYFSTMSTKCKLQSYVEMECPKCGGVAYAHRYDACHIPFLVYGYQYHCHSCGVTFEKTKELREQTAYIDALRSGKTFKEALEISTLKY